MFDAAQAYKQHFDGPMKQRVLDVRLADVGEPVAHLMHIAVRRIDGGQGIGRVASQVLCAFVAEADAMTTAQSVAMLRALCEVLNLVVPSGAAKTIAPASQPSDFHLHRIRRFIQANLRDPDLTAAKIAAAHGISGRYLSELFEHERVSVACYI